MRGVFIKEGKRAANRWWNHNIHYPCLHLLLEIPDLSAPSGDRIRPFPGPSGERDEPMRVGHDIESVAGNTIAGCVGFGGEDDPVPTTAFLRGGTLEVAR